MTSHTSGDGRFVFDGLSDAPYVLEVGARRATVTFHDVRTDGVEKIYQVPASGMPRAFVVGQVEGAAGCSITISPRGAYREFQEYEAVPEGGRFELGPLPPIAHDVGLSIADRKHTWWFVTADLATTDRCDLGLIRVPELGTLEVTVRDDLDCKRLGVGARPVHLGQTEAVGLERQGRDTWKGTDLPAGEYDVYVDDEQTAPMTQRVTVLPARTTKVVLVTAPGSVLAYRLALPDGVPKTVGYQMITFRSADGSVVDCWSGMGSLKRRTRLLDGSYTIDVTTGSGLRGSTTVVLPQPSGAEAVIPLTR
jgi:hypothetical protein